MVHKKLIYAFGMFMALGLSTLTPSAQAQVGELNSNDQNIIALCACVETAEKAADPQCQRTIAQFVPQPPAPQQGAAMHALGSPTIADPVMPTVTQ